MSEKVEVFVSSDGPIRLKVPWGTFIKFARESLSESLGKGLAYDDDSFVALEYLEGEVKICQLPDYVYLVIIPEEELEEKSPRWKVMEDG